MMIPISWIAFILLELHMSEVHEKACKNKDFCELGLPSKKDNREKSNHWIPDYKNRNMWKQYRKNLTTKISKHILCRYSILTIWSFDKIENKHCMKMFCICLWEQGTNVINFEKKNVTANRKSAKITSRFNDMLHLQTIKAKAC